MMEPETLMPSELEKVEARQYTPPESIRVEAPSFDMDYFFPKGKLKLDIINYGTPGVIRNGVRKRIPQVRPLRFETPFWFELKEDRLQIDRGLYWDQLYHVPQTFVHPALMILYIYNRYLYFHFHYILSSTGFAGHV